LRVLGAKKISPNSSSIRCGEEGANGEWQSYFSTQGT
jgi:hypothetical protein